MLNLLIKDICKAKEVADVIKKTKSIINRFGGRKRWPRNRLREVIFKNHKKKFGLYRAAETRFAGHVKEMGRLLRCKQDLQEVVISADYAKQDWRKAANADADDDDIGGEGGIKAIVLDENDENGFWDVLVEALKV